MIITIDTMKQEVEVYDEENDGWTKAYLKSMQISASIDELMTLDLEIALPFGMK